jgi:hypothetical protein
MNELIFVVEEAPEGGFLARALGVSIFTEADTLVELPGKVRDAFIVTSRRGRLRRSSAFTMSARKLLPYEASPRSVGK